MDGPTFLGEGQKRFIVKRSLEVFPMCKYPNSLPPSSDLRDGERDGEKGEHHRE